MRPITENRFWQIYDPQPEPSGSGDTLWQYEQVIAANIPLERVWSVIEADDNWYATPGFHVVNMMGYAVTAQPWTDITRDAVYFRR